MNSFKEMLRTVAICAAMADILILCYIMLAISSGHVVPHVAFFDMQLRVILNIFR
jgi:hypothetical protein